MSALHAVRTVETNGVVVEGTALKLWEAQKLNAKGEVVVTGYGHHEEEALANLYALLSENKDIAEGRIEDQRG